MKSTAPSALVDLRYLGNYQVTPVELLTFFPEHTAWRDVMWRLHRAGFTPNEIVRYILYSRRVTRQFIPGTTQEILSQGPDCLNATTYVHQRDNAVPWANNKAPDMNMGALDTERAYQYRRKPLEDYRLRDLAYGVVRRPIGADRQILTAAIEVAEEDTSDVRLSGFTAFVQTHWARIQAKLTTPFDSNTASHGRWDINSAVIDSEMKRIGYSRS